MYRIMRNAWIDTARARSRATQTFVAEEAGLTVCVVRYHSSQPWPFPQSLMLGFVARAESAGDLVLDPDEIEEAHWFSREQLLDGVWGHDVYIDERTVDVHVGRLRKALMSNGGDNPVRTVRGTGYSLG